jgi:fumarate reductase subunit D
MLKNKCKILFLLVAIVTLISTLSFATDESDIMLISEDEGNAIVEDEDYVDTEEESDTSSDDWIENDLYIFDDKVEINQIVDGNVFVFANEVVVTGEIGGDLFVCANKLTIDGGYVYSSVFALANDITINSMVYDVYAVSENFTLGEDGYIYRDLKLLTNTVNLNGFVRRDAYITATTYNFNEENGYLIFGNLKYSSNSEITIPDGIILGDVSYNQNVVEEQTVSERILSYVSNAVNSLVYTLVVILLTLWLAPKFVDKITNMNTKKALSCLGIGIIAPIVTVIALLILLVTTVCTKVALAGAFIFAVICMSSKAFASIYFGGLLAKYLKWDKKSKLVLSTLIATLIIWLISKAPYIGGIFSFLIALFGIGTLLVNVIKEKAKEEVIKE